MEDEPSTIPQEQPAEVADGEPIATLVARLSRPHPSGGTVIERAAIMAAGADSSAVLQWIAERGGQPEALVAPSGGGGGLFASGLHDRGGATKQPLRYVLPPG